MSNLENNKKLAEYMGHETIIDPIIGQQGKYLGLFIWTNGKSRCERYEPDKDWNQLMQVVEKIAQDNKIQIQAYCEQWPHCLISNRYGLYIFRESKALQLAVYQAVIEYVSNINKEEQNETK